MWKEEGEAPPYVPWVSLDDVQEELLGHLRD